MKRVLVVGAGPAGLAAAEALAAAGGVTVEVVTLEPYLGGSAASFTTPDGRVVEQGQHIMAGFYREMAALLARSGVDLDATTVSNGGRFLVWEDRDGALHRLRFGPSSPGTLLSSLAYDGLTLGEKAGFALFLARAVGRVVRGIPEDLDDLCFTAWALEHGLPPGVATTNLWRTSREAQFNWPDEISAYSILKTLRELARDYTTSEIRFPAGSMGDLWWEPVARRIRDLGGSIRRGWRLAGIRRRGAALAGLAFERISLDGVVDDLGAPLGFLDEARPSDPPERVERTDLDAAVVTVCPGSMQRILADDPSLLDLPGFGGIPSIRTVAPMGLHVWHRAAVAPHPPALLVGLEPPFAIALDNRRIHPAWRTRDDLGAVIHFVGQETGFEDWEDAALLDRALRSARRVPGWGALDLEGVLGWRLERDRAPHRRYWCSEPGSLRHKPPSTTAIRGLFLAGDWIRSDEDFPCMETAVRSGRRAARAALDFLEVA